MIFGCFGQQEAFPVGSRHQNLVAGAQITQVVGAHSEEQLVAVGIFGIGIFRDHPLGRGGQNFACAIFTSGRGGDGVEPNAMGFAFCVFTGGHHAKRLSGPERTFERGT